MVGENENDVASIVSLLRHKFAGGCEFFNLLLDINGDSLANTEYNNRFRKEFEWQRDVEGGVDLVIFIRDLDDLETNRTAVRKRHSWYRTWNKTINKKGILLLNIFELEALIWADIKGYNLKYGTNIPPISDPMQIWEPKEELRKHVSYSEGMSPRIFQEALRVVEVQNNCRYFREFLEKFEQALA